MYTLTDRKVVDGKKVESVRHLPQREYEVCESSVSVV